MMYFPILVYLLIVHILVDYVFQSDYSVSKKFKKENKYSVNVVGVLKHSLIYIVLSSTLFLILSRLHFFDYLVVSVLLASHFGIDLLKSMFKAKVMNRKEGISCKCGIIDYFERRHKKVTNDENYESVYLRLDKWAYVIDQVLHFIAIYFIARHLRFTLLDIDFVELMNSRYYVSYIYDNLNYILALLLITSFFNVSFKTLLNNNIKKDEPFKPTMYYVRNAGSIIGNLERIIVMICLISMNFSMIGFVIAVKSIARFDKMKDKEFAEYYLIGTLSSVIYTIVVYYLLIA